MKKFRGRNEQIVDFLSLMLPKLIKGSKNKRLDVGKRFKVTSFEIEVDDTRRIELEIRLKSGAIDYHNFVFRKISGDNFFHCCPEDLTDYCECKKSSRKDALKAKISSSIGNEFD